MYFGKNLADYHNNRDGDYCLREKLLSPKPIWHRLHFDSTNITFLKQNHCIF